MSTTPAKSGASIDRHDALSEVLAESWWAVGLRGVLAIAFGLICLLVPTAAILALILLFSAYMLVDGVFAIASGIKAARNGERWGLLILEGIVDIAAGAVAFLWPAITTVAFVILIAVWAIISGALMLAAALGLKLDHGRWWLALGGIASVIFGIVLLIAPVVGAVVLTWWLGVYALVFGAMLLVLAFQLHGKKEERAAKRPARPAAKSARRTAAKKA
ncbi:MAG TPA: HdeD family acid-resistance protein [Methyloceanibacter sp.]|nr:HdeD family acid-resistance protein [Methyloceanibacter sp.]